MLNNLFHKVLLILLFLSQGLCAHAPVVLDDELSGVPYKVTLYSMKDMVHKYTKDIVPINKNDLLFVGGNQGFAYLPCHEAPVEGLLKVTGADRLSKVLNYDKKRMLDEIFHDIKVVRELQKKFGARSPYTMRSVDRGEWGDVPVIFVKDLVSGIEKEWGASSHGKNRKNLFDMFSLEVDKYLVTHGFAEKINHKSETNFQISIFGIIKIADLEFCQIGFFQYTFGENNVCYHRAFKPMTPSCLTSLSNSYAQVDIKNILTWYFNSIISNEIMDDSIANDLSTKFNENEIKTLKNIVIDSNDKNVGNFI